MKLNLKAISEVLSAVKDYLFPYEKISKKFLKINNEDDLINFIKEKSAFVTQSTLYGYLKTRMGLKQNMMFTDDIFIESVNKAKWNIFSEAVTDLTFFAVSYLNIKHNIDILNPNKIYQTILDNEIIKIKIPKVASPTCHERPRNIPKPVATALPPLQLSQTGHM